MKRVLVVWYSQTGQLRDCAKSLAAPLAADAGIEVDFVELRPETEYPFPWGLKAFLSVFPESVLQEPPPLRPIAVDPEKKYDLIVLAYQVWYLSPAPPVVAFLQAPQARVLDGVPVVALCACRNMWQRGWVELKKLIEARGGRVVDHVALVDQGPAWATFYTTPRWLIAGKKEGGPFPPAGVAPEAVAGLSRLGERLRDALKAGPIERPVLKGQGALFVERKFLMPELAAKACFKVWARVMRAGSRLSPRLRYPIGLAWFAWLLCHLPIMPLFVLAGAVSRVVAPRWYRERVDELEQPSGGSVT